MLAVAAVALASVGKPGVAHTGPRSPSCLDVHTMEGGVSVDDVAKAHLADLATQEKHGVNYLRYWVDEKAGNLLPR